MILISYPLPIRLLSQTASSVCNWLLSVPAIPGDICFLHLAATAVGCFRYTGGDSYSHRIAAPVVLGGPASRTDRLLFVCGPIVTISAKTNRQAAQIAIVMQTRCHEGVYTGQLGPPGMYIELVSFTSDPSM